MVGNRVWDNRRDYRSNKKYNDSAKYVFKTDSPSRCFQFPVLICCHDFFYLFFDLSL